MRIAGMMRLAEIDQQKVGKENVEFSIKDLADKVDKLYFLQIGNVPESVKDFIKNIGKPFLITQSFKDYNTGWDFDNHTSLDDLYKSINEDFDWILYPDADDILPENTIDLLKEADEKGCNVVRFHFIECFGSRDKIIEIKQGFPIGPHFKAVKHDKSITFIGSDGFNEPFGEHKRLETLYCIRHLRYANPDSIEERKKMNYFEKYFLDNHDTIDYKPMQKIQYYKK